MLRTLRALFRYGHDLGYLKEVPIRRNDFVEIKRTEIDVSPVAKIRRLLEAVLHHDPGLLPLLLIETFCGVRPEEAVRVLWGDIDLLRGRLTIRAANSKTGTARSIRLASCARAWFDLCTRLPAASLIISDSDSRLRTRLRKVRYHAGYRGAGTEWPPGALRDAFCSYHLAYHSSIDRMIAEAGHANDERPLLGSCYQRSGHGILEPVPTPKRKDCSASGGQISRVTLMFRLCLFPCGGERGLDIRERFICV
jgi:integrase